VWKKFSFRVVGERGGEMGCAGRKARWTVDPGSKSKLVDWTKLWLVSFKE